MDPDGDYVPFETSERKIASNIEITAIITTKPNRWRRPAIFLFKIAARLGGFSYKLENKLEKPEDKDYQEFLNAYDH